VSWQEGTATDYLALLQDLVDITTNSYVDSAAVNAGGTGYAVGDILAIDGGTTVGGHTAAVEVLTVSTGAVTSVRIYRGGAYTVNPGTGATTTAETGSGNDDCTIDTTIASAGWTEKRRTQEAASAAVGSGGTGYSVGDDLTVVGGVGVGTAAVFNVDSLSGSAVATVSLVTAGDYEEVPANDVATTVSPAGGSGCELTVTWQDASTQDQVLILEGEGGGSDEILVGIETYTVAAQNGFDTCYNWSLVGMTAYNANLDFDSQPGLGPSDGAPPSSDGGAYIPLKDNDGFPIYWFASVTTRRIALFCRTEDGADTKYMHAYLGWSNPFGTTTEFPYPIMIFGSTPRHNAFWDDDEDGRTSGLCECIGLSGMTGPGWFRRTDSVWQEVKNSQAVDTGTPSRAALDEYTVYPGGRADTPADTEDLIVTTLTNTIDFTKIIPNSGIPGSPTVQIWPTPDTGGDVEVPIPLTVVASESTNFEIHGELDGCFWLSAADGKSSEDRLLISDDRYRIFEGGNRATVFSYICVKEE
jgi:hypothetical protein